jgi:hypothetical protein
MTRATAHLLVEKRNKLVVAVSLARDDFRHFDTLSFTDTMFGRHGPQPHCGLVRHAVKLAALSLSRMTFTA